MKTYKRVLNELNLRLKLLGFARRGSSWWQKQDGRVFHRIHIHKFSYGDFFRVHSAIHAIGIEDAAPWLNGPASRDGWYEDKRFGIPIRRYEFLFDDSTESIAKCADEIRDYIEKCAIPWFQEWKDENKLIESEESPLTKEAKVFLRQIRSPTT